MAVKIQNATPPTVMILLQPNFFYIFRRTVLTKLAYRNFGISNVIFFKKIEMFLNMGPNGSENFKMLLLPQF